MKNPIAYAALAAFLSACSPKNDPAAHMKTASLTYQQDGKDFEGYLALPKKTDKKLAGVLLIHDWTGLDDYEQMRARMLAENGYVAFAMDMYGKGVRATNHKEAGELSGIYGKDRKLLRSRIETALQVLKSRPEVDSSRIAIIGYCFGGMAAIEAALMAADIRGVVTFHAALSFPTLVADAGNIKVPLLIHHGGADKFVPEKDVKALRAQLDKVKAEYQLVVHPGATHGFTLKSNVGHEEHFGMKYDVKADLESWASMLSFLRKTLK
ncbi:dienelactone hydrolase family protein [Turneriella parva]|uniref:Dienelactone hydrolase n=1 Tax=Turneriella parva (strain ATCC BAA-1111 / DSM 21527 / NCTC 11395 / H) TaxID=869212 RepID=I4B7A7_TURPD|nr:dienelactone hydrolase family protein [Turneriella parva]AFM13164.1 dienelactone hydrolase [Turneriella parva DSM 21527]